MEMPLSQKALTEVDSDCVAETANDADRRQHARHVKVMRIARVSNRQIDAEGLGMVRDISSGGMMIDTYFQLEIGQMVTVALHDNQELAGEIVWKEGQTVGVHFDTEIPVDDILAKPLANSDGTRVRLPRFAVNRTANIGTESMNVVANICDVSQRGAKLRCDAKIGMHSNILIKPDALRPVRATVKWRGGDFTGVEFHRLLSVDELAQWLAQHNMPSSPN